ncbi:MAG: hypothetical protein GY860_09190 [Desulfobacteraceae bacterium]|nr:hypothetical protein [Desulfobacteraceae bacterium]
MRLLSTGVNKKVTFVSLILTIPFIIWVGQQGSMDNQKQDGIIYVGLEIPFYGADVLGSSGLLVPEVTTMYHLVMDRLFTLGPTGRIVPALGLTAQPSEDGKSWDIALRRNVTFHDGTDFTADAIVHHWKRLLNPENKFRGRSFFKPVLDVKKINAHKVRFILEHPWGAFLNVLSDEVHSFAYIPSPIAVAEATHGDSPVGTGPFKFDKWNKGDHFSVIRNDNYWQKETAFLEKIVFRQIPDAQTRYATLASGEVDVIAVDRGTIIQKAMKDDSMAVYPSQGSGAEIILINVTKPPLNDIRVRRALALANNQKQHIKMVYQNTIPFIHHPFGKEIFCKNSSYPEYDLEKAKQLIKDYSQPVEIECLHSNTLRGRNIGELLQQLYGKIGIKFTPIPTNSGSQVMKVVKKNFQMATWRILSTRDHGTGLLRSFHSQGTGNWTGYKNPEMDGLLEAQQRETNPYTRQEILCKIAALINTDVPFLYRGGRRFHVIARKKINNIQLAGEMVDFSQAWITGRKNNPWGKQNELAAKSPVDCSDPGDIEAVRKVILGNWKGKDKWGGVMRVAFRPDGTVTSSRGDHGGSAEYKICGNTIFWRPPGAMLLVKLEENILKGYWEASGYKGDFTVKKVPVNLTTN